jgi:hypothetical protein
MDPIEIKFTISPTLRLRICESVVMYRPLVPHNRDRANNLWSSKRIYENKFKLEQLSLVLSRPNLGLRQPI